MAFINKPLCTRAEFELRQVLAIPKEDIEARHDYLLDVIKDRVDNADVYDRK